jgi:hypothetical protein
VGADKLDVHGPDGKQNLCNQAVMVTLDIEDVAVIRDVIDVIEGLLDIC